MEVEEGTNVAGACAVEPSIDAYIYVEVSWASGNVTGLWIAWFVVQDQLLMSFGKTLIYIFHTSPR